MKFYGWVQPTQKETAAVLSALPRPIFRDCSFDIKNTGAGQCVILADYVKKLLGQHIVQIQEIGDCVSFGSAHAIDYTYCTDIQLKGKNYEFVAITSTEDIYGGSRVQIGKGQLGSEDGSIGAWAAQYVHDYGTLVRQAYENDDLTKYSGQRAREWGMPNKGVPNYLVGYAKEHRIKTVSLVRTYEEVRDSICNGYAVTVASNQGFSNVRDQDGFLKPQGNWGHQMCATPYTVIGYNDSKFIKDVEIGTILYDKDGNSQYVTDVYKRKFIGQIYKISSHGNLPLEVTGNHPLLVCRNSNEFNEEESDGGIVLSTNKKVYVWVNACDIKIGDYLVCPKPKIKNDKSLPKWIIGTRKTKNQPKDLYFDNDIAWLFGLYAADGTAEKGHKIKITLHENEIEKAKMCVEVFLKLGLQATIKPVKNKKAIRVIVYSSVVANSFLEWFGKLENKHLPEWIWGGWDLESVLNGVYAGDGGVPNDGFGKRITNTSIKLIYQCRNILLLMGQKPSISRYTYKNKQTWNDRFTLEWHNSDIVKYNYWQNDKILMKVYDIKQESYSGDVYNLEVDNTHSYIANGVVVHNCIIGVDDSYRRPGVLCLNSWPYNWVSGPTRHDMPPGSFWIDAQVFEQNMLSAGDSWVYSDRIGFERKELSWRIV